MLRLTGHLVWPLALNPLITPSLSALDPGDPSLGREYGDTLTARGCLWLLIVEKTALFLKGRALGSLNTDLLVLRLH